MQFVPCGHVFHYDCVTEWFTTSGGRACPLCKAVSASDRAVQKLRVDIEEQIERIIARAPMPSDIDDCDVELAEPCDAVCEGDDGSERVRVDVALSCQLIKAERAYTTLLAEHSANERKIADLTFEAESGPAAVAALEAELAAAEAELRSALDQKAQAMAEERTLIAEWSQLKAAYKAEVMTLSACNAVKSYHESALSEDDIPNVTPPDFKPLPLMRQANKHGDDDELVFEDENKQLHSTCLAFSHETLCAYIKSLIKERTNNSDEKQYRAELKALRDEEPRLEIAIEELQEQLNSAPAAEDDLSSSQRLQLMTLAVNRQRRMEQLQLMAQSAGMTTELNQFLGKSAERSRRRREVWDLSGQLPTDEDGQHNADDDDDDDEVVEVPPVSTVSSARTRSPAVWIDSRIISPAPSPLVRSMSTSLLRRKADVKLSDGEVNSLKRPRTQTAITQYASKQHQQNSKRKTDTATRSNSADYHMTSNPQQSKRPIMLIPSNTLMTTTKTSSSSSSSQTRQKSHDYIEID